MSPATWYEMLHSDLSTLKLQNPHQLHEIHQATIHGCTYTAFQKGSQSSVSKNSRTTNHHQQGT